MKRSIRLAVVAGAALAFAGVAAGSVAQEECESIHAQATSTSTDEAKPADPCADIEPGAASMEPSQALEDPPVVEESRAHEKWVEEIWNSP